MIVLDNGRSRIRESDEREILNCIRCGSCLTVCPVYSKVGGHAYGSVYGGPIGAVLTPLLTGMQPDEGRKLPFLSSLCGACTDACPVGIPLHDMLVRDRALANRAGPGLAQRARRLGRLVARLVEPAAVPRLGAGRRPLRARSRAPSGPARAGSTAARRCRCRARSRSTAAGRPGRRLVIDAFIAAVQADGGAGARASPDAAAARAHVAALLGRDATLCFWSGDPLVMSIDPASLGREVAGPPRRAAGITGAAFGVARDRHARADLRRGPLARHRLLPDLHIAVAARRPRAGDARRGDRARLRGRRAARR